LIPGPNRSVVEADTAELGHDARLRQRHDELSLIPARLELRDQLVRDVPREQQRVGRRIVE